MKKDTNKKILKEIKIQTNIAIVSIIVIILTVIGSSYAAFVWSDKSIQNQSLASGNYVIEIDDSSSSTISLESAYPMTVDEGITTTPYTFKIKNNGNTDIEFSLKLIKDSSKTNTLNTANIGLNLSVGNTISSALLSALPDNELDAGILPANASKTYELRLWLREDASNDAIGKIFNGKLLLDTKQIEITGNDYQLGDLNMNGIVDILDVHYAFYHYRDKINLTSEQKKLSDYDGDGTVSASDVNNISILYQNQSANLLSTKISADSNNILPVFTATSTDNGVYTQVGDGTRTKNGFPVLYFRGSVENNYVSFADILWRIVRVNEDGSIKLVTQNNAGEGPAVYNSNEMNVNYNQSTIKLEVEEWYQSNIGNNIEYDSKVVTSEFYHDLSDEDINIDGDTSFSSESLRIENDNFIHPIFKSSKEAEIITSKVGLLTSNELVYAGALNNKSVTNNTTYLDNGYNFWTMSPMWNSVTNSNVAVW